MPKSKKPYFERNCIYCSDVFVTNNTRKVYCSGSCNTLYNKKLKPEQYRSYSRLSMRNRSPAKKASDAKRRRNRELLKQYGITLETYEAMKIAQNNLCFLCKKDKELVVDHNHITGKVRGLLCHNCNRAIGLLGDNPKVLILAASYVSIK